MTADSWSTHDQPGTPRTTLADQLLQLLVDDAPLRTVMGVVVHGLVELGTAPVVAVLVAAEDGHMSLVSLYGDELGAEVFADDASSLASLSVDGRRVVAGSTARLVPLAVAKGYGGAWGVPLLGSGHQPLGCLVLLQYGDQAPGSHDETTLTEAARLSTLAIQREAARRTMRELTSTDPLTGLANRAVLVDRMGAARTRSAETGRPYALVLLGIDGVGLINESLGHKAGDDLLWLVAQRLQTLTGPQATLSRVWGDEIALLLEDLRDPDEATDTAYRLRTAISEPFDLDGIDLLATASFGVAVSDPVSSTSSADLLRAASAALEQAKTAGRAQIGVYAGDRSSVDLAPELRRGLAAHELSLAYQPIVLLTDRSLVGWEALLRWTSPLHGAVPPTAFVPVAERTGLVSDLGRYALRTALGELAARRARLPGTELSMSVNISAHELANEALPDTLGALLSSHGLPARSVVLEVTENVLLRGGGIGWRMLERLQQMGVRIAIDDFGTGFSQLSYLRQFRFDELKIDRSFVTDLASDRATRAIVSNLIAMATDLQTPVVVEGIESPEQHEIVLEFGATFGQGFLFGAATGS